MELPDFAVGRGDKFKIVTTRAETAQATYSEIAPMVTFKDKLQTHYQIEVHKSPDERVIHRIRFFYEDKPNTIWRSHVQVVSRGVSLPCPYKPGISSKSQSLGGGNISADDPLWAHAKY